MEITKLILVSVTLLIGGAVFLKIYTKTGDGKYSSNLFLRMLAGGMCLTLTFVGVMVLAGIDLTVSAVLTGMCAFLIGIFAIFSGWISSKSRGERLNPYLTRKSRRLTESLIGKERNKEKLRKTFVDGGCTIALVAVSWFVLVLIMGGFEVAKWGLISGLIVGVIVWSIGQILDWLGFVSLPHRVLSNGKQENSDRD